MLNMALNECLENVRGLRPEEEIAELKMKYKLLSQQLSQLKEEISGKDKQHQQEDKKKKAVKRENGIREK